MYSAIAYVFEAISAILSCFMIYQLAHHYKIIHATLNRFLLVLHVVNLFYQIGVFSIYKFDPWNPRLWSLIWVLEGTLLTATNFVNLLILQIFSVLRSQITEFKIRLGHYVLLIGYLLFLILPVIRLCGFEQDKVELEEMIGSLWVLISMTYDTIQAFYLTCIVYYFGKERGVSNPKGKQKVLINLAVVLLDWSTIAVFMYQSFREKDVQFKQIVQQVAAAMTGIHFTFTVIMFKNLTELSLGEGAAENHQRAKQVKPIPLGKEESIQTSYRNTDLKHENVPSIQWTNLNVV